MIGVYLTAFLIGICFGSFGSVLLTRLDILSKKNIQGVLVGRSHCPWCKHTLTRYNLLPLLSFLIQKWKCSHCTLTIPAFYPLLELLTGCLACLTIFFVTTYWFVPSSYDISPIEIFLTQWFRLFFGIQRLFWLLLVWDCKTQFLHEFIWWVLMIVVITSHAVLKQWDLINALKWIVIFVWVFTSLYVFARAYARYKYKSSNVEWIGMWDIFLAASIGAMFPYILSVHAIAFTPLNAISLMSLYLVLCSCLWILHRCFLTYYYKKKSDTVAFFPGMIVAMWCLLLFWKDIFLLLAW